MQSLPQRLEHLSSAATLAPQTCHRSHSVSTANQFVCLSSCAARRYSLLAGLPAERLWPLCTVRHAHRRAAPAAAELTTPPARTKSSMSRGGAEGSEGRWHQPGGAVAGSGGLHSLWPSGASGRCFALNLEPVAGWAGPTTAESALD